MAGLDHDDWRVRAECAGRDPELWFDADPSSTATRIALEACAVCKVRRECYTTALRLGESAGIWGGINFGAGKRGNPA
jgi:WhiB family redox-sensing transcriptional regulator